MAKRMEWRISRFPLHGCCSENSWRGANVRSDKGRHVVKDRLYVHLKRSSGHKLGAHKAMRAVADAEDYIEVCEHDGLQQQPKPPATATQVAPNGK
jgi:hypothetical protein